MITRASPRGGGVPWGPDPPICTHHFFPPYQTTPPHLMGGVDTPISKFLHKSLVMHVVQDISSAKNFGRLHPLHFCNPSDAAECSLTHTRDNVILYNDPVRKSFLSSAVYRVIALFYCIRDGRCE